jgi:fermentation-respiration switch protein FrsA (DUF1100 family)
MGFSGGAAVATYVTAHNPTISALILCACPTKFDFLIEQNENLVDYFKSLRIIRDKDFPPSATEWLEGFKQISPLLWIDKVSPRELLIVHGDQDEMVPISNAWTLYEKAREPKEIAIIKGGEHRLRLNQEAMKLTLDWLLKRCS